MPKPTWDLDRGVIVWKLSILIPVLLIELVIWRGSIDWVANYTMHEAIIKAGISDNKKTLCCSDSQLAVKWESSPAFAFWNKFFFLLFKDSLKYAYNQWSRDRQIVVMNFGAVYEPICAGNWGVQKHNGAEWEGFHTPMLCKQRRSIHSWLQPH